MWKNRYAQLYLFSVLLAFLPSASSLNGDPKYMVLVPSQLYTETPEKICFHLYHLNETVTVTASLVSQSRWRNLFDEHITDFLVSQLERRNLFDELVVDKDLFQCVSFIIPTLNSPDEEEFLYVDIKGPTHEFSKRKAVLVKNKESVVFVQTDKPVYKPGQSVKFRVVSMDKTLHPLNELDSWNEVLIGDVELKRVMACTRCLLTTVDPDTGISDRKEPLETLKSYRLCDPSEQALYGKLPIFGQYFALENPGTIRVGDPVYLLGQ